MSLAHVIEYVALATALAGLAAVAWEITAKDSRLFAAIVTDVRGMAEPSARPAARSLGKAAFSLGEPANGNERRKAA